VALDRGQAAIASDGNRRRKIMARTSTQRTSKTTTRTTKGRKNVEPKQTKQRVVVPAIENEIAKKLAGLFKSESVQLAAMRYARKVLKHRQGLRTSTPPTTGLTKKQAEQVIAALDAKKRVVKAPAKTLAEPLDS
jgi:hypothetical protein